MSSRTSSSQRSQTQRDSRRSRSRSRNRSPPRSYRSSRSLTVYDNNNSYYNYNNRNPTRRRTTPDYSNQHRRTYPDSNTTTFNNPNSRPFYPYQPPLIGTRIQNQTTKRESEKFPCNLCGFTTHWPQNCYLVQPVVDFLLAHNFDADTILKQIQKQKGVPITGIRFGYSLLSPPTSFPPSVSNQNPAASGFLLTHDEQLHIINQRKQTQLKLVAENKQNALDLSKEKQENMANSVLDMVHQKMQNNTTANKEILHLQQANKANKAALGAIMIQLKSIGTYIQNNPTPNPDTNLSTSPSSTTYHTSPSSPPSTQPDNLILHYEDSQTPSDNIPDFPKLIDTIVADIKEVASIKAKRNRLLKQLSSAPETKVEIISALCLRCSLNWTDDKNVMQMVNELAKHF